MPKTSIQHAITSIPGKRIVVVGITGAGKTTLARELSHMLGCTHIELDALFWGENWAQTDLPEFRRLVSEALSAQSQWIVDGNYSKVRDIVWSRADTIIWLNYGLPRILWQLVGRTARRLLFREVLWNNNIEKLANHLTKDGLLFYAVKSHRRHLKLYPSLLGQPEYSHLKLIRLRSSRHTQKWLANLPHHSHYDLPHGNM